MLDTPKITVLMPVYNGAAYVREAVESLLNQTFQDFELLIVNDGSTDDSMAIVSSFKEPRIKIVHNERNLGLIATLNRGIKLARAPYIARMDCDDVCLPERLAKQAGYLDRNPDCAVIATKIITFGPDNDELGIWNDDDNFATRTEILRRLPRANCIAHPSVMIRTEALAKYNYDPRQIGCEDYDLWLRMAADGARIDKLTERLLRYRMTQSSLTVLTRTNYPDLKNALAKIRFVFVRIGNGCLNGFVLRVFLNAFIDLFYFIGKLTANCLKKISCPNMRRKPQKTLEKRSQA